MAFEYSKEIRGALDPDTQATVTICQRFMDIYPQPMEYVMAGRKLLLMYEEESVKRPIVLNDGSSADTRQVVAIHMTDWDIRCEFVHELHRRLGTGSKGQMRMPEYWAYIRDSFFDFERRGYGKDYEATKNYIADGVRVLWGEGGKFPVPQVGYKEWWPAGVLSG
ncbi:hypothetical protein FHW69_000522 [Luteibacter sp. Sphag1AF]|uniref:hypothetical protein n=1 Tax=Luteibacter sp. Sphag1AF TaxID=2587031 RepID=UPI00161B0350|nr:hypothetical protein [Luteibacter sp. Sphag1AF]MBB3225932.1 hypothetical protein [Luteibacter sp. Sphag1AF]